MCIFSVYDLFYIHIFEIPALTDCLNQNNLNKNKKQNKTTHIFWNCFIPIHSHLWTSYYMLYATLKSFNFKVVFRLYSSKKRKQQIKTNNEAGIQETHPLGNVAKQSYAQVADRLVLPLLWLAVADTFAWNDRSLEKRRRGAHQIHPMLTVEGKCCTSWHNNLQLAVSMRRPLSLIAAETCVHASLCRGSRFSLKGTYRSQWK